MDKVQSVPFRNLNNPWYRFSGIFAFGTSGYWILSIIVDIIKTGMGLGNAMLVNITPAILVGIFFSLFHAWWFRNHSFHISKEEYEQNFLGIESAIIRTGCTHHKQEGDAHLFTPMARKPYLLGVVTVLPHEDGYRIRGPHFYIDRIKKNLGK